MEKRSRIGAGSVGRPSYDANEDDVLDDIAAASPTLLRDAAKDAMSTFLDEMISVWMFNYVDSPKLSVAHENVAGHLTEGKVDLILTDPPYNVRNKRNKNNSSRSMFTTEDMCHFKDVGCQ